MLRRGPHSRVAALMLRVSVLATRPLAAGPVALRVRDLVPRSPGFSPLAALAIVW